MTALDQHPVRAVAKEPVGQLAAGLARADRRALGLGQIRRDHGGPAEQPVPQRGHRVVVDQRIAVLADADRVDDHRHRRSAGEQVGHAVDRVRVPSMPVLIASTPMSSTTLRNCARTASSGSGQMPCTPSEFCAVTAVITLIPCTPWASIVFRSAWMPAPPPESEPAMVSTRAVGSGHLRASVGLARGSGRSRPADSHRLAVDQHAAGPGRPPHRADHRQPSGTVSAAGKVAASAWSSPPVRIKT